MLTGCSFINKKIYISNIIGIDISKCHIDYEKDTHGGFLGDGDYFAKINCSNLDNFKVTNNWKKLPLSSNLDDIMSMKWCDDIDCMDIFEKYNIPKINNGYYYFFDRHSLSKDKNNDNDLNNRGSYNFSLAIYDNNKIIYYYELDT